MEFLNSLIDNTNIPLLTAFLLGVLTSISPCPLATNITAVAFISKDIKTIKHTLLNGFFYTLGRGISYVFLASLIYSGVSVFSVSKIFEGWGDKILGPVLILISLLMFRVINFKSTFSNQLFEKIKSRLSGNGYLGSLLLGALFALAFCPFSGVLFFGVLIPLILKVKEGLILPVMFALGTGLPVIFFSFLIAISLRRVGRFFKLAQRAEIVMRYLVAIIFFGAGLYYLFSLFRVFN